MLRTADNGWTYGYDESTCAVTGTLTITPADVIDPQSAYHKWKFTNGSEAISADSTSNPDFSIITVPVSQSVTVAIGDNTFMINNYLHTFHLKLPRVIVNEATAVALQMFKLSDNNRGSNLAFSAILMGTLANSHSIQRATYVGIDGPATLDCNVVGSQGIIVDCGPFYDSASGPIRVHGVLHVWVKCATVGCSERELPLTVDFMNGDEESDVTGSWSHVNTTIWLNASVPEIVEDVVVAGDTLIASFAFEPGTVSLLTMLRVTLDGYTGQGSTLTHVHTAVLIPDTSYEYVGQSDVPSAANYFNFPTSYSSINAGVRWGWSALDVNNGQTFRGSVLIEATFDITIATNRRQGGGDATGHLYVQQSLSTPGAHPESSGPFDVVLISAAGPATLGTLAAILAVIVGTQIWH